MSSGGKNIVHNSWLWVVMGGGDEIMAGRGWRRQNYRWSWVVRDGRG